MGRDPKSQRTQAALDIEERNDILHKVLCGEIRCKKRRNGDNMTQAEIEQASEDAANRLKGKLTVTEFAKICRLSSRTIRSYVSRGLVECIHVGPKRVFIDPSEIHKILR